MVVDCGPTNFRAYVAYICCRLIIQYHSIYYIRYHVGHGGGKSACTNNNIVYIGTSSRLLARNGLLIICSISSALLLLVVVLGELLLAAFLCSFVVYDTQFNFYCRRRTIDEEEVLLRVCTVGRRAAVGFV